jgi:hypothetical protein
MRNLFALATGIAVSFVSMQASAQQITKPKYEISGRLSALVYQGDLSPSPVGSYKSPGLGFGLSASRIIDWNWAARVTVDQGSLKGDDALYETPTWRRQRNFSFNTSFLEASAQMVYTIGDNYQADRLQSYVFAGVGMSFLKIKREYSGFNAAYFASRDWEVMGLEADSKRELPKRCLVFPVGVGIRRGLGDHTSFFVEGSYRLMSTDYLDGFSRAANPSLLDHYSNLSMGLIWRFGDNYIDCPNF